MPINMVNERAANALGRIERALARIETVAVASPRSDETSLANAQLEQRHAALRKELQQTLGDIDALIAQSKATQD
jgi:hypothetical protein